MSLRGSLPGDRSNLLYNKRDCSPAPDAGAGVVGKNTSPSACLAILATPHDLLQQITVGAGVTKREQESGRQEREMFIEYINRKEKLWTLELISNNYPKITCASSRRSCTLKIIIKTSRGWKR